MYVVVFFFLCLLVVVGYILEFGPWLLQRSLCFNIYPLLRMEKKLRFGCYFVCEMWPTST